MKGVLSDKGLLKNIQAGGKLRQEAIAIIYNDQALKRQVIDFVKKNSGSQEEAIDIFHEGIIAFDENVRLKKYRGEGNLKGYLFSTCRFIWLNRLRRDKKMIYTEQTEPFDGILEETPEYLALKDEQKQILDDLLSRLGKKCEQILELWKLSYSMEEIAQQVGLKDAGTARRQRYKCYQKLINILDQEPHLKNQLK